MAGTAGGGGRESCSGSQATGRTRHILSRSQEVAAGPYARARVCNVPFALTEPRGSDRDGSSEAAGLLPV